MAVEGASALQDGDNTVLVHVTAPDGSQAVYTVELHRTPPTSVAPNVLVACVLSGALKFIAIAIQQEGIGRKLGRETDGTVPTFSAIPHSVPHTVHVARHNGPDRGGGHHINLVDECEQLHEILEELEAEAKAKANGGRFTASALARASKRRFVMSRRMTFFAADRAMMGGV